MQSATDAFFAEVSRPDGYDLCTVVELLKNNRPIKTLQVIGGSTDESLDDDIRATMTAEIVDEDGVMPSTPQDPTWPGGIIARLSSGPRFSDGSTELKRRGKFRLTSISGQDTGVATVEGSDLGYMLKTPMIQPYTIQGGIETSGVIQDIARVKYPYVKFAVTPTGFLTNPGVIDSDMSPLSECIKLGAAAGSEVFFNLNGQLEVSPAPDTIGMPVWSFIEGENATFWNMGREINNEDVPSAVIVEATHSTLASTLRIVVIDNNPDSPTYYYGDYGSIVDKISSDKINTRQQALHLGYQHLKSKGWLERYTFECSPNAALEVGDPIYVSRASLNIVRKKAVIESITYPLAPGPMRITATSRRVLDMQSLAVDG